MYGNIMKVLGPGKRRKGISRPFHFLSGSTVLRNSLVRRLIVRLQQAGCFALPNGVTETASTAPS